MIWRSILKVSLATGVFAGVHSALASRAAKEGAARIFGSRLRNGWYRVFYNVQSVLTLGALVAYAWPLPNRRLYRVRGPLAGLMYAGQAASLVYLFHAARQVGIPEFAGLASASAWASDGPVPAEPEAQGPVPAADGTMRATGPYAWSRHPPNFVPVPLFWLWPDMTVKLATFNVISTLYLVLGSVHEESRLRAAYGAAYERYQRSGVPFFVPRPPAFRKDVRED